MKDLITIRETTNGNRCVSVRELYKGLGLQRTNIKNWCKTNILENKYFLENVDWVGCIVNIQGNETVDYAISIEFAKHLAMKADTDKSHEYRNYFLSCEKALVAEGKRKDLLSDIYDGGLKAMEATKKLLEIEANGKDKYLTAKQVAKKLEMKDLTSTTLHEWFHANNIGTFEVATGGERRRFRPNDRFNQVFTEKGKCITGITEKGDERAVYMAGIVNVINEKYRMNLERFVFEKKNRIGVV